MECHSRTLFGRETEGVPFSSLKDMHSAAGGSMKRMSRRSDMLIAAKALEHGLARGDAKACVAALKDMYRVLSTQSENMGEELHMLVYCRGFELLISALHEDFPSPCHGPEGRGRAPEGADIGQQEEEEDAASTSSYESAREDLTDELGTLVLDVAEARSWGQGVAAVGEVPDPLSYPHLAGGSGCSRRKGPQPRRD